MPFAAVNGATLHYEEEGEGAPIVFIHGTGAHSVVWEPAIAELDVSGRLINYDRRGFGRSGGEPARRFGDHVADAAALLGHLRAGPALVVTQSGGSVIALRLAIDHPDLVRALVMAEPAYQVARHPSWSVFAAMAKTLTRWLVRRDPEAAALGYYRWATRYTPGGNAFDGYPDEWKSAALGHAPASLREVLQLVVPSPRAGALRTLSCPVTLLLGDIGEPVFHRTTLRVARLLPQPELVRVEGAGHLIATDQPRATAAAISGAMESAPPISEAA